MATPFLFEEMNKPKKFDIFEKGFFQQIFDNKVLQLKTLYLYTLNEGFQYKDANAILEKLKKNGLIKFDITLIRRNLHKMSIDGKIEIKS